MSGPTIEIDIGEDFSMFPGGRWIEDGENSGELFRKEFLAPILEASPDACVVIDLTGPRGYLRSFLEEVFGGIIRQTRNIALAEQITPVDHKRPHRARLAYQFMFDEVERQQGG